MRTEVIAPYLLRAYIWQVIKLNTDLKESDYGGNVPIVPLAEEPELTDYAKPYIVYGYSETPTAETHVRQRGNMAFIVYSQNFRTISQLVNIITRAFEKGDESARRVNEYTSTIPAFLGLRFGTIEVSFVEGGGPEEAEETEGGRQNAIVNINYEYFVDYDVETKVYAPSTPNSAKSTWPDL